MKEILCLSLHPFFPTIPGTHIIYCIPFQEVHEMPSILTFLTVQCLHTKPKPASVGDFNFCPMGFFPFSIYFTAISCLELRLRNL